MYPYIHIGDHTLYSFGLAVGVGIAISLLSFSRYFRRNHIHVHWPKYGTVLLPIGLAGAHLGYCLTHPAMRGLSWETRLANIAGGGFSYSAGLVTVIIAFVLLTYLRRRPCLAVLDSLFCVSVSYAFGKFGCFLAGDGDYGIPTNSWWGVTFPHGLVPVTHRVQPTMLFLAAWEICLFILFWLIVIWTRLASQKSGVIFGLYLTATSFGRYIVANISEDTGGLFGKKRLEWIYLLTAVVGSIVVAYTWPKTRTT